jgi:hypothetical protein
MSEPHRMLPEQLRAHCDRFNNEKGKGGVVKLAALLGWTPWTMWCRLSGQHKITQSDEIAVMELIKAYDAQ